MKVIYDQHGTYVGWLGENAVYNEVGHLLATIDDGMTFNLDGWYIGQFEAGIFRDKIGFIVGFVEGARSEAVLPMPKTVLRVPPSVATHIESASEIRDQQQAEAYPSLSLSGLTWTNFLAGHEPLSPWEAHPSHYELDLDYDDDVVDEISGAVSER